MKPEILISLGSLAAGLFAFFHSRYKSRELSAITQDVAVLKKQMDLFWGVVERQMSDRFHSPNHVARDALLDKVKSGKRLTHEEAKTLCAMLMEIIEKDALARADATLFLASLTARYAIDPREIAA